MDKIVDDAGTVLGLPELWRRGAFIKKEEAAEEVTLRFRY